MKSIRAVIADDHPAFVLGLKLALESNGVDVCGTASTGDEAVRVAQLLRPDVAILDVRMPGGSGLDACREIRTSTESAVLILSTFDDPMTVTRAAEAGAGAFLTKDTPIDRIVVVAERLGREPRLVMIEPRDLPRLTTREQTVLEALGEGIGNKEIARRLGVSPETVKDHCSAIFGKLGVGDRVQAVVLAQKLGMLTK